MCLFNVTAEDPPQFCQHETFNATCQPGHVVLVTSAHYGRMRVGRCIRTDSYIGCKTDVLAFVDRLCSGQPSCTFDVSSSELFAMQNCPKDLYAYLEATYECVQRKCLGENQGLEVKVTTLLVFHKIPCLMKPCQEMIMAIV